LNLYSYGVVTASSTGSASASASSASSSAAASSTATVPTGNAPTWYSLGCYTDSVAARTLSVGAGVPGGPASMTQELCTAQCSALGYVFSGTEYSAECYCGNSLANGGGPAPDGNAKCNMPCNGNAAEICGGPDRLTMFKYGIPPTTGGSSTVSTTPASSTTPVASSTSATLTVSSTSTSASATTPSGWKALGCYTDLVASRSLANNVAVAGGAAAMSNEACLTSCKAGGYTYSGTEYGQECWCGNALLNGGGPAPDGNAMCNMACSGDAKEICGGPNRLTLFSLNAAVSSTAIASSSTSASTPVTASSTSAAASSSVISSSTTSATSVATGLPAGWSYAGCYAESAAGRIMNNQQDDDPKTTVESCVSKCVALGYKVAGIEYGYQCFCDNNLRNDAALATSETQCAMPCPGNTKETCGDGNRVSVYNTGALVVFSTPVTKKTGLPGGWTYTGCLTDTQNPRPLPLPVQLGQTTSPKTCLDQCALFGYNAGGIEYGNECCKFLHLVPFLNQFQMQARLIN
jgi:hypothetical protein